MSASKEYKAVRNCILNELHLTKEDIIKNIEPLLEKLVKQCMLNTYGGNNQIEHWIRCMVNDELKQRNYGFVERISKEVIKNHVLNELNIIVSPKNERCVCENRVPSRKDGLYLIYGNGHAEPFTGENFKKNVRYIGLKHKDVSFAISLAEHDSVQLLDDDSREESGSETYYERECDALFDIDNIMQIYNVLSFHKPQTQIIAIVHNPALIYKLSKLDCVNFIEMTEGYLNKIRIFASN